jgi:hypothetical protein
MNSGNPKCLSLESSVDALMAMSRPAYVEIAEAKRSDSVSALISTLASPLLLAARRVRDKDSTSRCLVFVDCGVFETLVTECGDEVRPLLTPRRALLYVVREGEFLQLSGEAYVRNVSPMFSLPAGLSVTFACFRDLEALTNSWEFCAGFYIWDSSNE